MPREGLERPAKLLPYVLVRVGAEGTIQKHREFPKHHRIEFREDIQVFRVRICHFSDAEICVGDSEPSRGFRLVKDRKLYRGSVNEGRILASGKGLASFDDGRLLVIKRNGCGHVVAGRSKLAEGVRSNRWNRAKVVGEGRSCVATALPREPRERVCSIGAVVSLAESETFDGRTGLKKMPVARPRSGLPAEWS